MTKKIIQPTAIRPELLDAYRAAAVTWKAAFDTYNDANRAYLTICSLPSIDEGPMIIERRIAARETATARYLAWQEAQRSFFAIADQIQEEALV